MVKEITDCIMVLGSLACATVCVCKLINYVKWARICDTLLYSIKQLKRRV